MGIIIEGAEVGTGSAPTNVNFIGNLNHCLKCLARSEQIDSNNIIEEQTLLLNILMVNHELRLHSIIQIKRVAINLD